MKIILVKSLSSKFLFLTLFIFLLSCGAEKKEEEDASEEFEQAESELKEQIDMIIKEMPPPSEVPFLLEATGADFNESLINDLDKADSYRSTTQTAALNLGVYSADIGYLSSYNQTQEALNYLNEAKQLADHMGVIGAFDMEVIQRFENNLGSRDSLSAIIDETIGRTNEYLRDDDRTKIAVLVLSGSFVEGLYIATQLVATYPEDLLPEDSRNLILTPIIRLILEQEKPLEDLIGMLKTLNQDQDVENLIADLEELKQHYENLNIQEKISQNRADLVLTDETLENITAKVAEIRKNMTS